MRKCILYLLFLVFIGYLFVGFCGEGNEKIDKVFIFRRLDFRSRRRIKCVYKYMCKIRLYSDVFYVEKISKFRGYIVMLVEWWG